MIKTRLKLAAIFILIAWVVIPQATGQDFAFPYELEGYEFFDRGRLKGIRLAVSLEADIKRVFGEDCLDGKQCDLNDDWSVVFDYLSEREIDKIKYMPFPKYAGRLESITLVPKTRHSLKKFKFPQTFEKGFGMSSKGFGNGGRGSDFLYDTYSDAANSLEYQILRNTNYREKEKLRLKKGDLNTIIYKIPDDKAEGMFEKQKL